MPKATVAQLDAGQLDLMWQFLQLQPKCTCTKADVRRLKGHLDCIRQAMIQKDGGQRSDSGKHSVRLDDLGTYINFAVLDAMELYIYGGLDKLEDALDDG